MKPQQQIPLLLNEYFFLKKKFKKIIKQAISSDEPL